MPHFIKKLSIAISLVTSVIAAPNVIVILTDDLGYGDLYSFHQHKRDTNGNRLIDEGEEPFISTPYLDQMVAEGAKMSQHYTSAPVCAPARASLLQGQDQGHANIRDNSFDKPIADNHTLGTVMQQAGYTTACIGKWGIGGKKPPYTAHPNKRGFDYFYGYMEHLHGHNHYPQNGGSIWEQTTPITQGLKHAYTSDLFTARAKKFIIDHTTAPQSSNPPLTNTPITISKAAKPFFLYLAYDTPHAQLQVPTQAYPAGKGLKGGLQWPLNTNSGTNDSFIHPDYAALKPAAARHATMVRRLDSCMGDLLQTLRDLKIDDNTLVVFTSDNGTHLEPGNGGRFAHDPRNFDSYGELAGIKRDHWEGGIRVPTIAWWPKNIPAGSDSTRASAFWDWMPTLADAAGLASPAWSSGVSLIPELTGKGEQQDKGHLYFEYNQGGHTPNYEDFHPSLRKTKRGQMQTIFLSDADGTQYKGVRYNTQNHADDFRIYNVDNDPSETRNLANKHPKLQQQMKDKVLQVRRADKNYPRPYDNESVPAVEVDNLATGLSYKIYSGNWPWVPQFSELTESASGIAQSIGIHKSMPEDNFGLEFHGYFQAPKDGNYTFTLSSDGGSMLWLHDIHLIDNDFKNDGSEKSATIKLEAGYHPIRVAYTHKSGKPSLKLHCSTAAKSPLKDLAQQFYHSE